MKWKKLIHKQNARHYAWPVGWDTSEVIAEQLECSPERVREHLAPSIRAGEVEVKQFTIWDGETGRKVVKTGFRIAGAGKKPETGCNGGKAPAKQANLKPEKPSTLDPRPSTRRSDRWPFTEGAKVKRIDSPAIGTVKNGSIHWVDGRVTIPASRSSQHKLRLAGKG